MADQPKRRIEYDRGNLSPFRYLLLDIVNRGVLSSRSSVRLSQSTRSPIVRGFCPLPAFIFSRSIYNDQSSRIFEDRRSCRRRC